MSEYLIPHSMVRCIDCRDSDVSIDGYQHDGSVTLTMWCEVCDERWTIQVSADE